MALLCAKHAVQIAKHAVQIAKHGVRTAKHDVRMRQLVERTAKHGVLAARHGVRTAKHDVRMRQLVERTAKHRVLMPLHALKGATHAIHCPFQAVLDTFHLMTRTRNHLLVALFALSGLTLLVQTGCSSCEKKPPPVVDDPPPPPVDAGIVQLVPLDDSGVDAPPEAAPPKPHGSWTPPNTNVARIKQCCAAIRTEAKKLGAAPEATTLTAVAAQCDLFAMQAGVTGTAPEFAQVRTLLKGHTLPAACSGM